MTDDGDTGEFEAGATVRPPDYNKYTWNCSSCSTAGTEVATEEEAQAGGRAHAAEMHVPVTWTVQSHPYWN